MNHIKIKHKVFFFIFSLNMFNIKKKKTFNNYTKFQIQIKNLTQFMKYKIKL